MAGTSILRLVYDYLFILPLGESPPPREQHPLGASMQLGTETSAP